jgi:hypothetical protein
MLQKKAYSKNSFDSYSQIIKAAQLQKQTFQQTQKPKNKLRFERGKIKPSSATAHTESELFLAFSIKPGHQKISHNREIFLGTISSDQAAVRTLTPIQPTCQNKA